MKFMDVVELRQIRVILVAQAEEKLRIQVRIWNPGCAAMSNWEFLVRWRRRSCGSNHGLGLHVCAVTAILRMPRRDWI